MRLTKQIRGCEDRSCPAVYETDDPDILAVQGTWLTPDQQTAAGDVPAHEGIVAIPREMLHNLR
jgi:hypothetical protein